MITLTRQDPASSPVYRPVPPTLMGQVWAGLTRNTPAFTGARTPDESASQEQRPALYARLAVRTAMSAWSWSARWVGLAVAAIGLAGVTGLVLALVHNSHTGGAHHAAAASAYIQISVVGCAVLVAVFWRSALRIVLLLVVALTLVGLGELALGLFRAIQH